MTSDYATFRETRFFGSLDGLRALSVLGVIWFHCWWGTPAYSRFLAVPILRQGSFGVHVFFVISGFLITTLLLRERSRLGTISLRDFYIRRALRIWPLYYATIALYIPLMIFLVRGYRAQTFFHYLPYFLTYTYTWFLSAAWNAGTFNLAWTLCTEEQFYAFWPLILRFARGRWAAGVLLALVGLRFAAGHGFMNSILPPGSFPYRALLSVSLGICFGVFLAQALHSEGGFRYLNYVLGRKWSAPVAMAVLAACLAPEHVPMTCALLAGTALVGACVVREDNGLAFVLGFRPIAYVGVLSYGMYLLNSLSVHAVEAALGPMRLAYPALIFPFAVALAAGLAALSHRYLEARFLRLKSRFSRLRIPPPHRAAARAIAPATEAGEAAVADTGV